MDVYFGLKEIGLVVALMGLSGFVSADMNIDNSKILKFDSSGILVSFDYAETGDDQASSETCAQNPTSNNSMSGAITEPEAIIAKPEPQVSFTANAQPLLRSASASPLINANERQYPLRPNGMTPQETENDGNSANPTTPEPTTLLILGLSLAGFIPLIKRYRQKI
jgi:hypothetical protein